jgi:RimJ/RimL family protein N-acetyltransferase
VTTDGGATASGWLRAAPSTQVVGAHLTLRRWRRDDLDDLTAAVTGSLELLRPWMRWAAGYDRRAAQEFLTWVELAWLERSNFAYAVVDPTGRLIGGGGLRASIGVGGLEIGYWVRSDATRRRVATRTAALLTAEALAVDGVTHVEIHHDRANELSGRVPRRLGYEQIATAPRPRVAPAESGVEVRWRLTLEGYATSMARTLVAGQADAQP